MSQREAENPIGRVEMSQNLRDSLQRAITYAYEQSHRQVTLEHLLLALAEDREAAVILEASSVSVQALVTEVSDYLGRISDRMPDNARREPALGGDVQHIIQSAGAAAQKSQRRGVSSALALAAIVGDGRSPAAQMLRNHGLTFEHAIAALKRANSAPTANPDQQQQSSRLPTGAPSNQQPSAPARPVELQPSEPQTSGPRPTATAPPVNDDARLQNVQAAHDIIAQARERIAAARGTVAAHTPNAQPEVAEPSGRRQPPEPVRAEPEQVSVPVTPEPVQPPQAAQEQPAEPPAPQPPVRVDEPQPQVPPDAVPAAKMPPASVTSQPVKPAREQQAVTAPAPAQGSVEPAPPIKTIANEPVHAAPGPALREPTSPPPQAEPLPAARQVSERRPQAPPAAAVPTAAPQPPQSQPQPPSGPAPAQVRRPPQQQPERPAAHPVPRQNNMVPPSGAYPQRQHPADMATPPPQARPAVQAPAQRTGPPQQVQGRGSMPVGYGHPPPSGPSAVSTYPAADVRPIEPARLTEDMPTRMCVGVPSTIEIRAPRAQLEAWSGGGADPRARGQIITKAMAMRLRAPEGGFTIEIASPETQWSEGYPNPLSDDVVSWRWMVTPTRRGRLPLQLNVSTRVVGRDGLAAERVLPEQLVSIKVTPNYVRTAGRLAIALVLVGVGVACGYLGESALSMGGSIMAQLMR
jgi:neural Wiskott-Aldrich syndrome protein